MPVAGFALFAGAGAGTGFGAGLGAGSRSMNGRRSGSATAAATAADPLAKHGRAADAPAGTSAAAFVRAGWRGRPSSSAWRAVVARLPGRARRRLCGRLAYWPSPLPVRRPAAAGATLATRGDRRAPHGRSEACAAIRRAAPAVQPGRCAASGLGQRSGLHPASPSSPGRRPPPACGRRAGAPTSTAGWPRSRRRSARRRAGSEAPPRDRGRIRRSAAPAGTRSRGRARPGSA